MSEIKPLLPLAAATGISIIGLGTIIPSLPFYATSLGAGPDVAAMIFSVFSAASLLSAPFWGMMSDKVGRKPVMVMAVFFTVLSYLWMAHAGSLWELYASRIMAGLTAGWMAASQAYVADVTSPENRAKGLGLLGASFGIGFTVGPIIGAIATHGDHVNFALPAYIAAGFAVTSLLVTLFFVKEPKRHHEVAGRHRLQLLKDPDLARLIVLYFLVFLMFTGVEGIFALWAKANFGLGPSQVGYFLGYSGIIMILVQGGIGRAVAKRGEGKVTVFAICSLLGAFVSAPFITGPWGILIPMGLFALAMGLHNPAMQSLLSRLAPAGRSGGVMGVAQSTMSMARIAGPAWAGAVFTHFGADAPFYLGALLLIPIIIYGMLATGRAQQAVADRVDGVQVEA
ncbi:MFS transporter [Aestuariispira ectoiniformans]|uniref:MFS transporter n=1 Tax=Aestuariispira ectoiniformans TaxID=2775080 RepID=UPI00223C01FA|nr:MFS transporter [Aestuariispira ectoiniformans]